MFKNELIIIIIIVSFIFTASANSAYDQLDEMSKGIENSQEINIPIPSDIECISVPGIPCPGDNVFPQPIKPRKPKGSNYTELIPPMQYNNYSKNITQLRTDIEIQRLKLEEQMEHRKSENFSSYLSNLWVKITKRIDSIVRHHSWTILN